MFDRFRPLKPAILPADIIKMQSVFCALEKIFQLFLFLLEKTWVGSAVEAVVGKTAIVAAVIGAIHLLNSADAKTSTVRQAKLHS